MLDMMLVELSKCAKLAIDSAHIKPGEEVLLIAETASSRRLLDVFSSILHTMGIKFNLIIYPTIQPRSLTHFTTEPTKMLADAMKAADVVIFLNNYPFSFTKTYTEALKSARYLSPKGFEDSFLRLTAGVNLEELRRKAKTMGRMLEEAKVARITTPEGSDVTMELREKVGVFPGEVLKAGDQMFFPSQNTYVAPEEETVNGTIIVDFMTPYPRIGILYEPIKLTVRAGEIITIDGGKQAKLLESWFRELKDPNLPYICHINFGFNPYATFHPMNMYESESILGTAVFGIGRQSHFWDADILREKGQTKAKGHLDGVSRDVTLYLDDEIICKKGTYVDPSLR